MIELSEFDAAEYLDNEETIIEYLNLALADEDPKEFLRALNTVARARGMMELARKTGMPRESLYRALSERGNPSWQTLRKISSALGFSLTAKKAAVTA